MISDTVGFAPADSSISITPADSSTLSARPPFDASSGIAIVSPSFNSSTDLIFSEYRFIAMINVSPIGVSLYPFCSVSLLKYA